MKSGFTEDAASMSGVVFMCSIQAYIWRRYSISKIDPRDVTLGHASWTHREFFSVGFVDQFQMTGHLQSLDRSNVRSSAPSSSVKNQVNKAFVFHMGRVAFRLPAPFP